MYEDEKENLKKFRNYIVQIIRPSNIKGFLTTYLETAVVERILSEENRSVTTAAELLLGKMCDLEEMGWFQGFLDALLEGEYNGLYNAIKEWDFKEIERMSTYKKLLERIEASFTKQIKPCEIITRMTDCFVSREVEEIRATDEQKGHIAAAEKLVECLKRSDRSNCFKLLLLALEHCDNTELLQLLDPERESAEEKMEIDVGTTTVVFQYREQAECASSLNSANWNQAQEGSTGLAGGVTLGRYRLREYQKELAMPALQGRNTLICGPTGCGKTLVALAICEHHLRSKSEAKIVFLATKLVVYEQQLRLFLEYFNSTDAGIRIKGVCGDMEDQVSMDVIVEGNDIIVLTPQILLNALNKGTVPSLSVFTLLIFDECHNATRKHPYNMLMGRYLDSKLSQQHQTLPQIVGLTASVGIGTFRNSQEAEMNICQLCANLDTRIISTVNNNKEELQSFVHIPEKDFSEVEKLANDEFVSIIRNIMVYIESQARRWYDIGSLSNLQTSEHGTQKYEQWIVDIQKKCKVLQLEDKEEESRVCRALFNYMGHLRKYNDALIINEDARTKDALNYLEDFIKQVKDAGFDEIEQELTARFEEEHHLLAMLSQRRDRDNPKLTRLKFILDEQYTQDEETRTLLFVRTRALTEALKNWIEETDSLRFLKPTVLMGSSGSGMTQTYKKGILQSFKKPSDQSKILIATSVADEGVDIPQCNLVLMYEYIGNMIKTVQVRGRGRAKGSKCILISSRKERIEKERQNMLQEKMVEKAVARLQTSQEHMLQTIESLQKSDKTTRDYEKSAPVNPRTEENHKLLCAKCKKFACFSDDLRVLKESQHIVLDKSIFERSIASPHPRPRKYMGIMKEKKLFCANCHEDWGIVASYRHLQNLPLLKIESFVVESCVTQQQRYFGKWKEVTFVIKPFIVEECL
ncbi:antiviral innate immune response receptor RIG-I [Paramormyrops kingsleyae]|uniref:antiviral innate immune response receptor RIG-I n=1 Tax=Paramormyrops kingsleyae TaxID=1676925 RepID=UPI003B974A2B